MHSESSVLFLRPALSLSLVIQAEFTECLAALRQLPRGNRLLIVSPFSLV